MQIAMIGTGYVGLVSGACFSEFGHDVTCVDKDAGKIARLQAGEVPIFEPGIEPLIARNVAEGRLSFSTDLVEAVRGAEAVFIAVGTPSRRGDGHADLDYVHAAAGAIGAALNGYTVIVTKSTVPVGTSREVAEIVRKARPDAEFDIASNPEFLREGAAITDFMRPDRVVIGTDSERAREVLGRIYRPLYLIETPIIFTEPETAELIKYAANAFLATKITFINEMADLCEKVGADVHDVARGIGLDGRIGRKFLHAGPGYGGSCFPAGLWRFLLSQGHAGPGAHRPAGRRADADRRIRGRGQRRAQETDGGQDRRALRRLGRRQDSGRARSDLQAEHRRHARCTQPGHRAGVDQGRCDAARLRSRRP